MTMQLFSFGHPCEHQLRRTCIGGSSCPLHGYPDAWCCSFVKGKINFKRDKPCEGPRCRWGFTHPTQAQFDAVTLVISEGKAIGAKLDESGANDLLQFQIDSPHVVDTVQCALHVMKHPPSSCGKKIGQLLAYAALKAQEVKVFTQLLKTMKKPIDAYLLGAYEFLTHQKTSAAAPGAASAAAAAKKGGKKDDAIMEELRSDIVDVMSSALSQNGQLVVREDQTQLQMVFIAALKTFPKNRKKQDLLETALAKFKLPPPGAASAVAAATTTTAATAASSAPSPPCNIDTPELPPATPVPASAPRGERRGASDATAGRPAPVDDIGPKPQASTHTALANTNRKDAMQPRKVVGMSRYSIPTPYPVRKYAPLHPVDTEASDTLILGGLFSLSSKTKSLLGPASTGTLAPPTDDSASLLLLAAGGGSTGMSPTLLADGTSGGGPSAGTTSSSNLMGFSIFGAETTMAAPYTSHADPSLLEGVMYAWGQ